MEIIPAPPCTRCGRNYVDGSQDLCRECLLGHMDPAYFQRPRWFRCDCGKRAVIVVLVRVGMGGVYAMRLPLCKDCLKIEEEM